MCIWTATWSGKMVFKFGKSWAFLKRQSWYFARLSDLMRSFLDCAVRMQAPGKSWRWLPWPRMRTRPQLLIPNWRPRRSTRETPKVLLQNACLCSLVWGISLLSTAFVWPSYLLLLCLTFFLFFLVHAGLFQCLHTALNPDLDSRIFNVYMWSFCMGIRMRNLSLSSHSKYFCRVGREVWLQRTLGVGTEAGSRHLAMLRQCLIMLNLVFLERMLLLCTSVSPLHVEEVCCSCLYLSVKNDFTVWDFSKEGGCSQHAPQNFFFLLLTPVWRVRCKEKDDSHTCRIKHM